MTSRLGKNQKRLLRRILLEHNGNLTNKWLMQSEREALRRLIDRGLVVETPAGYKIPDEHNEMLRDFLGIEL